MWLTLPENQVLAFCRQRGPEVQTVVIVVLVGSDLVPHARSAFAEDLEDRIVGLAVGVGSLDRREGTIQGEVRHMA